MFHPYRAIALSAAFGLSAVLGGCGGPAAKDTPKSEKPAESPKPANTAKPADGDHAGHDHAGHKPAAKAEELEGLAELSPEDRALAEKQDICPVTGEKLGSMGKPYKVTVKGQTVFLCCDGCEAKLLKEPDKYLAKLKK